MSILKKIDKLILSSFIGPYILSFFIAEFVLVMQFLWKYVDEILGKGYTIFDIGEMIIYFMITQIPMALPISILLSTVMVYGNLAERYELSSMKSAGISLLRIMRPGIMLAVMTALLSLLASNVLKPQANYQFQHRMRSIRAQKPALVIESKIFNKDFRDFSIRVDEKLKDNETIKEILIYDHSNIDKSLLNLTKAESGRMYEDPNTGFLVMELNNGTQYSELRREHLSDGRKKYPMMRTKFDSWKKVFNTEEFSTDGFSVNINRNKEDMLNAYQLVQAIDSVDLNIAKSREDVRGTFPEPGEKKDAETRAEILNRKMNRVTPQDTFSLTIERSESDTLLASLLDPNSTYFNDILQDARNESGGIRDRLRVVMANLSSTEYRKSKYRLRLHQQFSFAVICIVFMFLGAPLGSIIRKGGFGYPLLYAIGFYMIFIMTAIMGEKLIRNGSMDPILSAWIPNLILAPIAIYLTYLALRDAKSLFLGDFSGLKSLFSRKGSN